MYEAHYGLRARPFLETLDPGAYVAIPSREQVLRRLRYGLEYGRGPVVAMGLPGSGKSLLARVLARDLGGPSLHLGFPILAAPDLLEALADGLDAPAAGAPGAATQWRRLQATLARGAAANRRVLAILDDAQLVADPGVFETLRLLLNFASTGPPDLGLVLLGTPELISLLPAALADRIAACCVLGPLSEAESAEYLNGRLAAAGATRVLLEADVVAALHAAAGGMPRRLARLADLCLLIAYARERPRPDLDTVVLACEEAGFDWLAA